VKENSLSSAEKGSDISHNCVILLFHHSWHSFGGQSSSEISGLWFM